MSNTCEDAGGFKLDFLDDDHAVLKRRGRGRSGRRRGRDEEAHENVDATEEILARVNARNLTWHKQPEQAKFYGGVVEFGQQQPQMMGTLMSTLDFTRTLSSARGFRHTAGAVGEYGGAVAKRAHERRHEHGCVFERHRIVSRRV